MFKKTTILITAMLFVLNPASACDIAGDGQSGFLPENDLNIGVHDKFRNDMTEERFNEIIDRVDKHYRPIVKSHGGKLKWSRGWDDGTVNASAQRFFWTWKINMYGGLARHSLVTDDAFAMVVCHEMGHHLGGAPKVGGFLMKWASNEGQSDYFASLKCFRRVFESDDNEKIVSEMKVPELVKEKCADSYSLANDVALCVRSAMAGESLAKLLGSLRGNTNIDFATPDTKVVSKTDNKHPAAQCRLDTYFQGAICDKRLSDNVSNDDATAGTCNRSFGYDQGVRPLCWYKPE
ncbi:MAG: hypothetical protein WD025_04410 [Bacteriovoracaceae bacterium]